MLLYYYQNVVQNNEATSCFKSFLRKTNCMGGMFYRQRFRSLLRKVANLFFFKKRIKKIKRASDIFYSLLVIYGLVYALFLYEGLRASLERQSIKQAR